MKKRATLYWIILGVWLLCLAVLTAGTVQICMRVQGMGAAKDAGAIILLTVNAVILGVLWLGSLKDLVFSVAYASMQRRMRRRYREKIRPRDLPEQAPRFVLLYCTCNDFNARALAICLKQRYPNFKAGSWTTARNPNTAKRSTPSPDSAGWKWCGGRAARGSRRET